MSELLLSSETIFKTTSIVYSSSHAVICVRLDANLPVFDTNVCRACLAVWRICTWPLILPRGKYNQEVHQFTCSKTLSETYQQQRMGVSLPCRALPTEITQVN